MLSLKKHELLMHNLINGGVCSYTTEFILSTSLCGQLMTTRCQIMNIMGFLPSSFYANANSATERHL